MRLAILLLLSSFLGTGYLLAQSSEHQTLWSKKQGLSSNTVYSTVKGKDGFLWIATSDGLNRFDGETFEVFRHSGDTNSIQSNTPLRLLFTHDQKLVVGFLSGGVSIFDSDEARFKNFLPGRDLPNGHVEAIFETPSRDLWITIREHGFFILRGNKFQHLLDLPGLDMSTLDSIYNRTLDIIEVNGTLWFATHIGLYTMPKGENKPIHVGYANDTKRYGLRSIAYDQKDKIWMGSWTGGLFSYDLKTKEWKQYTYSKECADCFNNIVNDVELYTENELILATDDRGLVRFNTVTKKFQLQGIYDPQAKPNTFVCNSVLIDDNRDLWVGTDKGLLQLSYITNKLTCLDSVAQATASYYDAKHDLTYVTHFTKGIHVIDHRKNEERIIQVPIPASVEEKAQAIVAIAQRSNGDLYVLSKECLWRLDITSWQLRPVEADKFVAFYHASLKNGFAQMLCDSDDNLWILNDLLPIILKVDVKDSVSEVLSRFPFQFATEASDKIWFGWKRGISIYDKRMHQITDTWKVAEINGLGHETVIQDVHVVRDTLWIATKLGLFRAGVLEKNKLSCVPLKEDFGLSFESFHHLVKDNIGNLWFTVVNMGIGKLLPNGNVNIFPLTDLHGNDLSNDNIFLYRLSSTTINNRNAILFGTARGAYWLYPDSAQVSNELPVFSIKESTIPGKIVDSNIKYLLKRSREISGNNLSIVFNLVYFRERPKIKYAYRFKELSNQWTFGDSKNRYISSHDFPRDRTITLEIKLCNEFNVWSQPLYVKFIVNSPIWQRAWFIVLISALLITSVVGIVRFAIAREKKKATQRLESERRIFDSKIESEKERLELKRRIYSSEIKALRSQMNPHFIFNTLNTLQDRVFGNRSAEATKYIGDFGLLLRKILTNSDYPFIKLKEEISMIELYLKMEALRFKDQFTWEIKVDPEIDADSVEFPPMLVQPIVENAVLHGLLEKVGERNLLVYFFVSESRLVCRVEDNGIGILKHRRASFRNGDIASKGTTLIKDRISLLNEAYSINGLLQVTDLSETTGEGGTRVELSFDLSGLNA